MPAGQDKQHPGTSVRMGEGVYGLANAFLLAGGQHYIGTFWDIPDAEGAEND